MEYRHDRTDMLEYRHDRTETWNIENRNTDMIEQRHVGIQT